MSDSDLQNAIAAETVDTLKKRYQTFFGVKPKQLRKAELVEVFAKGFSDHSLLKACVERLTDLELTFLRESVFNYAGRVERKRFTLKYGKFPDKPQESRWYSYSPELTDAVDVFFYNDGSGWRERNKIPSDLMVSLELMLERPEPDTLKLSSLPEPLPEDYQLFERERLALSELHSLLVLLQDKQLKVSEKTGVASGATIKKVAGDVHEYYDNVFCDEAKGMDQMLSYGWLRLLGNSKLARQSGTTLIAARKTGNNPAEILRDIWNQWVSNRKEDEFRRIDRIKGQNGKGKRHFTDVVQRRQTIINYLKKCQVNEWVAMADFANFMFITGADLEVTTAAHFLYIYGPEYGEFQGGTWDSLEVRYLRCFLVEYAATLGLIDVVMAPPDSDESFYDGIGDMACLSRYDGLCYFRLTPLGSFILGMTEHYQAEVAESTETRLTIHRQGRIVFEADPTPWEQRFLSLYADQDKKNIWNLSRKKMMETQQIGGSIDELKKFLLTREDQPFLPEDCEGILKQAAANLDGVKIREEALIVTCKNQKVVEFIVNDKSLSQWCQRLGKLQVVIPKSKEKKFRDSLNSVGIGCS